MITNGRFMVNIAVMTGGLLAAAAAHGAVAVADTYEYVSDPTFGVGVQAAAGNSSFAEQLLGFTKFDIYDITGNPTTPDTVSEFFAMVSGGTNALGAGNDQIVVQNLSGAFTPSTGSLFDTAHLGSGYSVAYSDLVGAGTGGTNLVAETLDTPYGDITIPTTFDAAAVVAALPQVSFGPYVDPAGNTVDYALDPSFRISYTAASGIPGIDENVSGSGLFDTNVVTSNSTTPDSIGHFSATVSDNTYFDGVSNQQLVVQPDPYSGNTGDYPSSGSLFDTTNFGGGFENVYSDLVGAGAGGTNLIADTLRTPYGDISIPTTWDAAATITNLTHVEFGPSTDSAGQTYEYVPDTTLQSTPFYAATSGIPGLEQHVSAGVAVDVDDITGNPTTPDTVGTFSATLTNDTNIFGVSNQQLFVQYVQTGTAAVPAHGSIFDTTNFGGGFENVYSDLVGAGTGGANLVTDTFDTPFGDFTIPTTFDASALLTTLGNLSFGPFADAAGDAASAAAT